MDSAREQFVENLFALHFQSLLKYGSLLIGYDRQFYHCVEECVQETLVAAFQAYEHLQVHPNVLGWLRITLENRIKQRMKKERPMMRRNLPWDDVSLKADVSDADEIEQFLQEEECKQRVEYALSKLKPKEFDIIAQFYLEGRSVKDIALAYQTSQSVINVRLHRIRKKMKRILDNFIFLLTLLFLKSL